MNGNYQNSKIINDQFITKKKVSSGSFGVVYLGQDIKTKELVAIKMEKSSEEVSLEREVIVGYRNKFQIQQLFLRHLSGTPQIPQLYWSGKEGKENYLVIQFLGRDLTHYLKTFRKFSLKCVLSIAEQMLSIIEIVHKKQNNEIIRIVRSIVHRDIKPENVLVGRDRESQLLYLVDFGISKFYRDDKSNHIPFRENKPFIGTTRYASIAAHKGFELSRKDDLESLGYMLIFLLKGQLPWQSLKFDNDQEKMKQVGQMKMKMDTTEICKGIPIEFARYLDYIKKLNFKSQPDYKYLQQLFKKLSILQNFQTAENKFDWESAPRTGQDAFKRSSLRKSSEDMNNQQFKRDSRSGFGSSIVDPENPNSLLKVKEPRKNSQLTLSPVESHRRLDGNRKQSFLSINESFSQMDNPLGSVLVGFQPSMLSYCSKSKKSLSKQLSQASKNSNFQEMGVGLSPPQRNARKNKMLTLNTVGNGKSYLEQLQRKKLDQMSQKKKSIVNLSPQNESFTKTSQQLMNDEEEDNCQPLIEKYTQLQTTQVKARLKKHR